MKTLVLYQAGNRPLMRVEDRQIPGIRDGYSLVRMHAATVNPLSELIRNGAVDSAQAPLVLSNDGSGIVEQSGRFAHGTRVAIYGGGQLGITEDGLQQQWVLVQDQRLIELPESFDLDEGAALPINYVTALQALSRIGQVKPGATVLISGASGSVGHALVQTALALEAKPVAVVSSAQKAQRARASGALAVIDLSQQDLLATIRTMTAGHGADLALDPVGGPMTGHLLSAVRPRGTVVSIGFVAGATANVNLPDLVVQEKRLLGYDAWMETDTDLEAAFSTIHRFIGDGLLRPIIDSAYPLAEFELAYGRLKSRKAMGTILLRLS